MKIEVISLYPAKLPLRKPWKTSKGVLFYREGWIVRIKTIHNLYGCGDCFPMPEMGTESLKASRSYAKYLIKKIQGKTVTQSLSILKRAIKKYPNTCFAFEAALLNIQAQQRRCSIAGIFNKRYQRNVQVNDNLGALLPIKNADIKKSMDKGYKIIKIKVGVSSLSQEIEKIYEISELLNSDVKLRLDANQAWNTDDAYLFLDAINTLPIESVEEPIKKPSIDLLSQLQQETDITIAVDESLPTFIKQNNLYTSNIKRFVIKPALFGGLRSSFNIVKKAQQHHIECVVTSMIESSIGLNAAIQFAAAIDHLSLAHGFSTVKWIRKDIAPTPTIKNAMIKLNTRLYCNEFLLK